jgi:anti-anti-sigma regulatory factor
VLELLDEGFAHVVIDLRRVTFLDSSGIRALIAAHRRGQTLGARLSIRAGATGSRRALEITRALDYLKRSIARSAGQVRTRTGAPAMNAAMSSTACPYIALNAASLT